MGFIGSSSGKGDIAVFTKYRFWRKDSLGLQESAAVLLKVITDTADSRVFLNKKSILRTAI